METKRPPFRPKVPIKCAGPYSGTGDPKMTAERWDEVGKDLYEKGYNAISVMLTLPTPMKFLPLHSDFTLNEEWVARNYDFQERMAFWRQTPRMKFFNQYHEGIQGDPFGTLSVEQLYSSWTPVSGKPDGVFWHTQWDEPRGTHHVYKNFRPTSKLGRGIKAYFEAVVANSKKVKELKNPNGTIKYPDFKVGITLANETMAVFEDGEGHPYKTRGDREELTYWLKQLYEDAGFEMNKNLWMIFDYLAFRPDIHQVDYGTMADVSQDLKKRGFRLEIHGIMDVGDIDEYVQAGVDPRTTDPSTDGDKKYVAKGQQLLDSKYHIDLKVDCKPGEPFFPKNFIQFWRTYFPPYGAQRQ